MKALKNLISTQHDPGKTRVEQTSRNELMLDIDFFDLNGKWNPRVVLFSAASDPQRARSGLTKIFAGLMKFQARRWAENYFLGALATEEGPGPNRQAIEKFLENIKRKGVVEEKEFHRLATIDMLQKTSEVPEKSRPAEKTYQEPGKSGPRFLNRREVIANTLTEILETCSKVGNFSEIFGSVSKETIKSWVEKNVQEEMQANFLTLLDRSSSTQDAEAHQVIAKLWIDESPIQEGRYAPPLIREAAQSGFLDYCKNKKLPGRDADRECLKEFLTNPEIEWKKYSNFLSKDQYQNFMLHRDQALQELSTLREKPVVTKTPREIDPKHALPNRAKISSHQPNMPAHEAISEKFREFEEASHGLVDLPYLWAITVQSEFIHYCKHGSADLAKADPESLEAFIKIPANKWSNYRNILTDDQFSELEKNRSNFIAYCEQQSKKNARTTHSNAASRTNAEDQSITDDSGPSDPSKELGELFASKAILTTDDLLNVNWDSPTLYKMMQDQDAEKIKTYFGSASITKRNNNIARKSLDYIKKAEGMLSSVDSPYDERAIEKLISINTKISKSAFEFIRRYNLRTQSRKKKSSEVSKQALHQLNEVKKFLEPRYAQQKTNPLEEKKS